MASFASLSGINGITMKNEELQRESPRFLLIIVFFLKVTNLCQLNRGMEARVTSRVSKSAIMGSFFNN